MASHLDPEEMREVLTAYQNAVTGEIARLEGHVAKLMGDGVLAYFGWPKAHEDEAERAVRSGLAIGAAVARLKTPAARQLNCRVGIATGLVVIGDLVGEGSAQEEAVVGETPNLAARLQELAEPGTVIVGDTTRRLLGELFVLTELRPQLVKASQSQSVLIGSRARPPLRAVSKPTMVPYWRRSSVARRNWPYFLTAGSGLAREKVK